MQQSLSNGTPNPKLSKMLDILIDHFSKWIHIFFLFAFDVVFALCCGSILAFWRLDFEFEFWKLYSNHVICFLNIFRKLGKITY